MYTWNDVNLSIIFSNKTFCLSLYPYNNTEISWNGLFMNFANIKKGVQESECWMHSTLYIKQIIRKTKPVKIIYANERQGYDTHRDVCLEYHEQEKRQNP